MADVEFELTYSFAATLTFGKEFLALERPVDGRIIAVQVPKLILPSGGRHSLRIR